MRTLEEASAVTAEARDILAEFKRIVHQRRPSATILLYGSVSRGTQTPESDYDLLVLTEQRLSNIEEGELKREIYDLELEREVILSTIFYSWEQWDSPISRGSPFYDEVQKDAIRL